MQPDGGIPSYLKEGFLPIQNAIARAFIDIHKRPENETIPEIRMQRFPTPSHTSNDFAHQLWVPLLFLISLNYTFLNIVRLMSVEKEGQLNEALKSMGVANWMHLLSWFMRTMLILLVTMVVITVILTVNPVFISFLAKIVNSEFFRTRFVLKI